MLINSSTTATGVARSCGNAMQREGLPGVTGASTATASYSSGGIRVQPGEKRDGVEADLEPEPDGDDHQP